MRSRSAPHRLVLAATVAALSAFAVTPAPATATVEQDYLTRFLPIARAAWSGSPCLGHESVTTDEAMPDPWVGYAWPEQCRVEIAAGLGELEFCNVLVHEFGHLAGLPNLTGRPDDVMNETPGDWPGCVDATWRPTTISDEVRLVLPPPALAWRLTIGPVGRGCCRYVRAWRPGWRVRRYKVCPAEYDGTEITQVPIPRITGTSGSRSGEGVEPSNRRAAPAPGF